MNYKDFGQKIRDVRRSQGLTQELLAEKVGLSASFLGHIERGTRVASLDTLVLLCNTLKISPEYLLQDSLDSNVPKMPENLSAKDRDKLRAFLRLAQDTVAGWDE